jgi:hypothetical protein
MSFPVVRPGLLIARQADRRKVRALRDALAERPALEQPESPDQPAVLTTDDEFRAWSARWTA